MNNRPKPTRLSTKPPRRPWLGGDNPLPMPGGPRNDIPTCKVSRPGWSNPALLGESHCVNRMIKNSGLALFGDRWRLLVDSLFCDYPTRDAAMDAAERRARKAGWSASDESTGEPKKAQEPAKRVDKPCVFCDGAGVHECTGGRYSYVSPTAFSFTPDIVTVLPGQLDANEMPPDGADVLARFGKGAAKSEPEKRANALERAFLAQPLPYIFG